MNEKTIDKNSLIRQDVEAIASHMKTVGRNKTPPEIFAEHIPDDMLPLTHDEATDKENLTVDTMGEAVLSIPDLRPGETITIGDPPQIPVFNQEVEKIARILHDSRQAINEQCVAEGIGLYTEGGWDTLTENKKRVYLYQADWIMQRYEIRESCNDGADGGKSRVRARIYKKRIAELEAAMNEIERLYREALEKQDETHKLIVGKISDQHQMELLIWRDRAKNYLKDSISLDGQVNCLRDRLNRIMELIERPPVVDSIRAIINEPPAEVHYMERVENR